MELRLHIMTVPRLQDTQLQSKLLADTVHLSHFFPGS